MNDFPGSSQVAVILTNRLWGAAAALLSPPDISLAALALNESVQRWLQLQHPRALVQQPPPPSLLPPVPSLRNQNWATRAPGAAAPPNRNKQLAGRSRSSRGGSAQPADGSCWVSHREFSTEPSPADGAAGKPTSSWVWFVEAVLKTAFPFLDWLWSWEKRFQKGKMQ